MTVEVYIEKQVLEIKLGGFDLFSFRYSPTDIDNVDSFPDYSQSQQKWISIIKPFVSWEIENFTDFEAQDNDFRISELEEHIKVALERIFYAMEIDEGGVDRWRKRRKKKGEISNE